MLEENLSSNLFQNMNFLKLIYIFSEGLRESSQLLEITFENKKFFEVGLWEIHEVLKFNTPYNL